MSDFGSSGNGYNDKEDVLQKLIAAITASGVSTSDMLSYLAAQHASRPASSASAASGTASASGTGSDALHHDLRSSPHGSGRSIGSAVHTMSPAAMSPYASSHAAAAVAATAASRHDPPRKHQSFSAPITPTPASPMIQDRQLPYSHHHSVLHGGSMDRHSFADESDARPFSNGSVAAMAASASMARGTATLPVAADSNLHHPYSSMTALPRSFSSSSMHSGRSDGASPALQFLPADASQQHDESGDVRASSGMVSPRNTGKSASTGISTLHSPGSRDGFSKVC